MFTIYWDNTEAWANIFYFAYNLGLKMFWKLLNFCGRGRRRSRCIKTDNTAKNTEMCNNCAFPFLWD